MAQTFKEGPMQTVPLYVVLIFCANWFNTNDTRHTKTHMGWTLQAANLIWNDLTENL